MVIFHEESHLRPYEGAVHSYPTKQSIQKEKLACFVLKMNSKCKKQWQNSIYTHQTSDFKMFVSIQLWSLRCSHQQITTSKKNILHHVCLGTVVHMGVSILPNTHTHTQRLPLSLTCIPSHVCMHKHMDTHTHTHTRHSDKARGSQDWPGHSAALIHLSSSLGWHRGQCPPLPSGLRLRCRTARSSGGPGETTQSCCCQPGQSFAASKLPPTSFYYSGAWPSALCHKTASPAHSLPCWHWCMVQCTLPQNSISSTFTTMLALVHGPVHFATKQHLQHIHYHAGTGAWSSALCHKTASPAHSLPCWHWCMVQCTLPQNSIYSTCRSWVNIAHSILLLGSFMNTESLWVHLQTMHQIRRSFHLARMMERQIQNTPMFHVFLRQ